MILNSDLCGYWCFCVEYMFLGIRGWNKEIEMVYNMDEGVEGMAERMHRSKSWSVTKIYGILREEGQ